MDKDMFFPDFLCSAAGLFSFSSKHYHFKACSKTHVLLNLANHTTKTESDEGRNHKVHYLAFPVQTLTSSYQWKLILYIISHQTTSNWYTNKYLKEAKIQLTFFTGLKLYNEPIQQHKTKPLLTSQYKFHKFSSQSAGEFTMFQPITVICQA